MSISPLSGASTLEWLGGRDEDPFLIHRAGSICSAVQKVLREWDSLNEYMGGSSGTDACVDATIKRL